MGTGEGHTGLRGLYNDPARPLTVPVGPGFGLVSMPAAVGAAALAALRSRRVRLGPVVADERRSVMRIGFLLAPERGPLAPRGPGEAALRKWAAESGAELGIRVGGLGTTATLPPLVTGSAGHRGWLRWIVPPAAEGRGVWTPAWELWGALAELDGPPSASPSSSPLPPPSPSGG